MTKLSTMTETEQFLEWYRLEQKKGLVDIKFYPGNITNSTTQEDFFRELNLINKLNEEGKTIDRADVF